MNNESHQEEWNFNVKKIYFQKTSYKTLHKENNVYFYNFEKTGGSPFDN